MELKEIKDAPGDINGIEDTNQKLSLENKKRFRETIKR